jgi:pyroglutamyl-peptidase
MKIPVKMSNSAGTYLCNHLMYESLYQIKKRRLRTIAGFIHVPPLEKVGAQQQLEAAKAILEVIIEKGRK